MSHRKFILFYYLVNTPVVLLILILWIYEKKLNLPWEAGTTAQVILGLVAALTGFVFPMWLRILYARRQNKTQDLEIFEKINIILSNLTFLLAVMAFSLKINVFLRYFIVLIAFYALYVSYPSQGKLNFDKKLLRLKS